MPVDQDRIPLYSPGDHIVGFFSAQEVKSMRGVDVVTNKRGKIQRANLKPLTCHVVKFHDFSSTYGTCPTRRNEQLPSGLRLYALRRLAV